MARVLSGTVAEGAMMTGPTGTADRVSGVFKLMGKASEKRGPAGVGTVSSSPLPPGQAVDVESCGIRGNGSAKDDYVRLLVYVDKLDFEDCHYKPSLRIPRSLKVHTVW